MQLYRIVSRGTFEPWPVYMFLDPVEFYYTEDNLTLSCLPDGMMAIMDDSVFIQCDPVGATLVDSNGRGFHPLSAVCEFVLAPGN